MNALRRLAILTFCLLPVSASACVIDLPNSRVGFTARLLFDLPVTGRVTRFKSQLSLMAARPQDSRAVIVIDTASLTTDDDSMDKFIRTPEMLDSARYPSATFTSFEFDPVAADRITVRGELAMKGKTQKVTMPFTYRASDAKTGGGRLVQADGSFSFRRLPFGIGAENWSNKTLFKDEIQIDIHLEMLCP